MIGQPETEALSIIFSPDPSFENLKEEFKNRFNRSMADSTLRQLLFRMLEKGYIEKLPSMKYSLRCPGIKRLQAVRDWSASL